MLNYFFDLSIDSLASLYVFHGLVPAPSLQVMTNINGKDNWNTCFIVPDVDLPTGYYLGMSAATGDLAGNTNTE